MTFDCAASPSSVLSLIWQVYAVDLSPVPLAYAAFNAKRLGVGDRLTTLQVRPGLGLFVRCCVSGVAWVAPAASLCPKPTATWPRGLLAVGGLPVTLPASPILLPSPLQGSWYEPLQAAGVRQLAGIVSNPPYICATDMPGLQAEVGRCVSAPRWGSLGILMPAAALQLIPHTPPYPTQA